MSLTLDPRALEEVRETMTARVREGLARDGQQILALPAWQPRPSPALTGSALVLDTGGTNLRAAVVELRGGGAFAVTRGPEGGLVPHEGDAAGFYAAHLEQVLKLGAPKKLPVGYCFSYPVRVLPDGDATLIGWTKSIHVAEMIGTRVGAGLRAALAAAGMEPGPVAVANDSVTSLLGGAYAHGARGYGHFVGVIVGTGTNMAALLPTSRIAKVDAWAMGEMAVNLESGNYHPPHLTPWDDAADARSDNPGRQRFEKAVSGYYLPYVFREVVPDHPGFDPHGGTRPLVELAERADGSRASTVARQLLDRSADLVAAALAGLLDVFEDAGPFGILAEGSLIQRVPGYAARVQGRLREMIPRADLLSLADANLAGAACATLAPRLP